MPRPGLGLLALPGLASAAYFPDVDWNASWQEPGFQPWDPLRATEQAVTVAWTPGWNPWCAVTRYELEYRRPAGHPLAFASLERLQFRETDLEDPGWPDDQFWTPWEVAYHGLGRVYTQHIPMFTGGHALQFRVRACGKGLRGACMDGASSGCSRWSTVQTTHTVIDAAVDKVNINIRGTGKNNPDYTVIEVDHRPVYRRRDETGLVLAIFSRYDLGLVFTETYDTHRNRSRAVQMAKDIKRYNQSHFVMVASTIAWEWHAARILAQTLEFCGAYHFGQWAHVFAEQPHYASNESDLQQTASQDEFGHPYAFLGIPGIGTGMGYESLMHNTGLYLATGVKVPKAIVRAVAYYDYVSQIYRLQDVETTTAEYYVKARPPPAETLHNPTPAHKAPGASQTLQEESPYKPYVGTLQSRIPQIIEANSTVPPHNFAFVLVTIAGVHKVDPRPKHYWITELERVWEGPSARYWHHNGSLILPGALLHERNCTEFIYHGYNFASPESCGPNYEDCCPHVDSPGMLVTQCGVGVAPTLCKDLTYVQYYNKSEMVDPRPFNFTVIDTPLYPWGMYR